MNSSTENPEVVYAAQLIKMEGMGFGDRELNIQGGSSIQLSATILCYNG